MILCILITLFWNREIFLFLLCILGLLLRWQELHQNETGVSPSSYTLSVRANAVDPQTVNCLKVGDALYTSAGEPFGYVRGISAQPAAVTLVSDGVAYSGTWDPLFLNDLTLEIEIPGVWKDRVLLHGGRTPLAVGQTLALRSESVSLSLKLYKMTPTEP